MSIYQTVQNMLNNTAIEGRNLVESIILAADANDDWRDDETRRLDAEFDAMREYDSRRKMKDSKAAIVASKLDVCNWMEVLGIPVKYDA